MQAQAPAAPYSEVARWHFSLSAWAVLAFALAAAFVPFTHVLLGLFKVWNGEPEYSHGVLIPFISLFLIWRERDALTRTPFRGSWFGAPVVILGILLWCVGQLSTIWVVSQYAFLVVVYGLVLALVGSAVFRRLWMPLLILIFMIPLPAFFQNTLSLKLQLLSSSLGVAVIRLLGISVYLEGNVIDLGSYKLQVAEACNGLRYLFPLMTLAFIVAYFFRAPLWKRVLLFAASIPIAVLMNSLRIGVIGATVEYWGPEMAEGVLHQFEGWLVFMISTLVLLLFAAILTRIGPGGMRLRDALQLDLGPSLPRTAVRKLRPLPASFLVATVLTASAAVLSFMLPQRVETPPARATFIDFPMRLDDWTGSRSAVESVYLDQLKLTDYLNANFGVGAGLPINVWISYYDSQRQGQSTHSPKACLPGSGWEFQSLKAQTVSLPSSALTVNRGMISNGQHRALMYYWFQQRGRVVTNEYLVKWFIFRDALTRNRSDGALVRLMVALPTDASEAAADRELSRLTAMISTELPRFVPN
jgi:exosortase D (VPLPA-CTERM-specific)